MRTVRLSIASLAVLFVAHATPGATLVLVAGGANEQEPVAAIDAKLRVPFGIDFNRKGTLVFVELEGQRVRAIDASGQLATIAGTGQQGHAGDGGPALYAQFNSMHNLAIAGNGDIYLADTGNNCVRKLTAQSATVMPFAGTGRKGFSGDGGPAAAAEFGGVYCVALNPQGNRLYLADLDNRRIRSVNLVSGTVETVAGNGQRGAPVDGDVAKLSPLVDPRAVAADSDGNVYILERIGNALRLINADGRIGTLVGKEAKDCRDEQGREPLPLKGPKHLCLDLDGNVIIADTDNHLIRKYLPRKHQLIRIAGTGKPGAGGLGGPPLEAELRQPHGVCVHPSGAVYIADSYNNRLLKLVP
jgi:DNA-binding beta-propeller fold protein YncE